MEWGRGEGGLGLVGSQVWGPLLGDKMLLVKQAMALGLFDIHVY